MRTVMLLALVLLSPRTILVPFASSAAVTTTYVTYEGTTTVSYTSTAFDTSFVSTSQTMTLQAPMSIHSQGVGFMATKGKCGQFTLPLTVKSGAKLNLEFTSTNPANLFLLPTSQFQSSPNGCTLIGSSLLAKDNFTAYTMHWNVTGDGTLYLLLTGPNTIIILRDHGSTAPVEQFGAMTYAITETNLKVYTSTNRATYTATTTIASKPSVPPSLGFDISLVAFLITLLGSILLLGPRTSLVKLKGLKRVVSRSPSQV
jgi:hypothetical protein